jgi:chemotaxis protein MotB
MRFLQRHRNKANGEENETFRGGWEIVYSGFAMILLCFFIMLSSFSTIEEAKIMGFVKSFVSAVSITPGGLSAREGQVVLPYSAPMVETRNPLAKIYAELEALSQRLQIEEEVTIALTPEGLSLRLSDHTLFKSGAVEVSPEALPFLDKIGSIIARTDYNVRIEGHTDNVPIHNRRFPSNWELSTSRAVNVLRYLIEHFQISAERLSAAGFGEYHPIAANSSVRGRSQNRRVEIIFTIPSAGKRTGGVEP